MKKKAAIWGAIGVLAAIVLAFVLITIVIPANRYSKAEKLYASAMYEKADDIYVELGDYKDSEIKHEYCAAHILKDSGKYEAAVKAFTDLGEYEDSSDEVIESKYLYAEQLLEKGKYTDAETVFEELGEFKDSADKVIACKYGEANELADYGKYSEAAEVFESISTYKDSAGLAKKNKYAYASQFLEEGKYQEAEEIFTELADYEDSQQHVKECKYAIANGLLEDQKYEEAQKAFKKLGDYKDSAVRVKQCRYSIACGLLQDKKYEEAYMEFVLLGSFSDSESKADESLYGLAVETQESEQYQDAIELFEKIPDYEDSAEHMKECKYAIADGLLQEEKYEDAQAAFEELGEYSDSADKALECRYNIAAQLQEAGEYENASSRFEGLGDYKDSSEHVNECKYSIADELLRADKYEEAQAVFEELGDYSDSKERAEQAAGLAEDARRAAEKETETEPASEEVRETEAWKDLSEFDGRPEYEALDYVELGEYKGLSVTVDAIEITDENVDDAVTYYVDMAGIYEEVVGGVIANGDVANIDYVGKLDGEEFDGGSAQGYDLTIGSGTFIDGFEDGLIGAKAGETVDVYLTFPEAYQSEELAGKDAVFTVTVNAVKRPAEISDEVVSQMTYGEYTTVEDYREYVREQLIEAAESNQETTILNDLMTQIFNTSTVTSLPEDLVEYSCTKMENTYQSMADYYGMSLEDLIQAYMGMDIDTFRAKSEEDVRSTLTQELILVAIAEKEEITITDEEYEEGCVKYAEQAGTDIDTFKETYEESEVRSVVLQEKVLQFLKENAVITVNETESEATTEN